ncbi:MAG: hypothetical protein ACI9Y7_002913 [Dokdonia sp.]|jgi:hypothetical protein
MKKPIIYFTSLLIIASSFYSCGNDDDTTPPPVSEEEMEEEEESTNALASLVEELTNNSSQIWKIETAELTNSTSTEDVSNLFNIKDDEFVFSVGDTPTEIILTWKKGFAMGPADDIESLKTDTRVSSQDYSIEITVSDDFTNIKTPDDSFVGNININNPQGIFGLLYPTEDSEALSVYLTPKLASDYVTSLTSASNPIELFQFDTGIFRVGFKVSQSQNSIYLTNRNDLAGIGMQQAFKYDLTSNTPSSFEYSLQDFATKNIEFLENKVVSIGGNAFENMDYEFMGVNPYTPIDNAAVSNGTASLDNTAYLFSGIVNGSDTAITTWMMGNANFQDIATLPVSLNDMDGEIVNQVLYMFGGWDTPSSSDAGSNIVYTFHVDTGALDQITIPVNLRETYTSTVENIIYVGGLQPIDTDNDGQFDDLNPYLGAFNTLDNSFQEIALNVGDILDNKRLVHLQVVGNKAFLVTSENLGAPDGFMNRVYEATLN